MSDIGPFIFDTVNYYDIITVKQNQCEQLFKDIEYSIKNNIECKNGSFEYDKHKQKQLKPLKFNIMQCSQYEDFIKKNSHKINLISYNPQDFINPCNKNYKIYWNNTDKELKIRLNN